LKVSFERILRKLQPEYELSRFYQSHNIPQSSVSASPVPVFRIDAGPEPGSACRSASIFPDKPTNKTEK